MLLPRSERFFKPTSVFDVYATVCVPISAPIIPLPNLCLGSPNLSYLGFALPSIVRCKYTLYFPRINLGTRVA